MSHCQLVSDYLSAFYVGDFERAKPLLTEDFEFKGPFVEVMGREQYFSAAARLGPIVRGHSLLRQWEDDDAICSIYEAKIETPLGWAAIYMSEWNKVRLDRIARSRLVFDSAAFRALVQMQ